MSLTTHTQKYGRINDEPKVLFRKGKYREFVLLEFYGSIILKCLCISRYYLIKAE